MYKTLPYRTGLTRRSALIGISACVTASAFAAEQNYPAKPIHLVHSSTPGGPVDSMARVLADALTVELGQPVIVEGKAGASGTIAIANVLSAPDDGYTLLLGTEGMVTEVPHTLKVRYDPAKDIKAVIEIGDARLALIATPGLPVTTLAEYIAYTKKLPDGTGLAGSYGTGGLGHLAVLQLAKEAGIGLTYVAYKATLPALQDVIGGHLPIAFVGELGLGEYVGTGKLKILAVTGNGRSTALPDVPSFDELGLPGLGRIVVRMNLWVRPGTSGDIRARLRTAVASMLKQDSALKRLAAAGFSPVPVRTEQQIASHLLATSNSMGATLRAVGIRPE